MLIWHAVVVLLNALINRDSVHLYCSFLPGALGTALADTRCDPAHVSFLLCASFGGGRCESEIFLKSRAALHSAPQLSKGSAPPGSMPEDCLSIDTL